MLDSMLVAITAETPRNGSGSTTSSGVNSTGGYTTAGRGARGCVSGEIGSLTVGVLPDAALVNFEAATGATGADTDSTTKSSKSLTASKDGLTSSPVGSAFGAPTGL